MAADLSRFFEGEFGPSLRWRTLLYLCGTCHHQLKFTRQDGGPDGPWSPEAVAVRRNQPCPCCTTRYEREYGVDPKRRPRISTFCLMGYIKGVLSENQAQKLIDAHQFAQERIDAALLARSF